MLDFFELHGIQIGTLEHNQENFWFTNYILLFHVLVSFTLVPFILAIVQKLIPRELVLDLGQSNLENGARATK